MVRAKFAGLLRWLVTTAACALCFPAWIPGTAAQTPTPDQVEVFKDLSPEQQQAILESMGGRDGSGTTRSDVRTDRSLNFPRVVRPREGEREDQLDLETGVRKEPRFKGDDTLLLSLEIRRFERRAPEVEERERRQDQRPTQPVIPGRQMQIP